MRTWEGCGEIALALSDSQYVFTYEKAAPEGAAFS